MQEKQQKNNQKQQKHGNKGLKAAVITLAITTGVLGLSTIGLGVGYGLSISDSKSYATQLENIYEKNYYELVDSANNCDTKISKLLASDNQTYQAKMLTELAQSSRDMQNNIASLPLAGDNLLESVRFINQMSGYTQVLEEKIAQGQSLSEQDLETLEQMHETLTEMKKFLNDMTMKMQSGYSILKSSRTSHGDLDEFSSEFGGIKTSDTDYPTMIYDGPFSDSVVDAEVKGLKGESVSKEEAYAKVDKVFKNIMNLKYAGTTEGKFETYNFDLTTSDDQKLFVQVTKIGGYVLTVNGHQDSDASNIDFARAKEIALNFVKANGVEDATVVWHETLRSQAYFNIAPVENGVVLYPDLVKVKVDLEHGNVIGYDAITYFTNHVDRNLKASGIGIDLAREKVDSSFKVNGQRLVLAPLDYNREVLCYEFEASRDDATYYIYINAQTGEEENILKVLETDDGSKLM